MVICNLPHNNHTIWLCCDNKGEPYLLVSTQVDSMARYGLSHAWSMAKYWRAILTCKNWAAIKPKEIEKLAIAKAIELLGGVSGNTEDGRGSSEVAKSASAGY
jgi:hypothetical protein